MGSRLNRGRGFKPRREYMARGRKTLRPWWEEPPSGTRANLMWHLDREHSWKVRRRDRRCVIEGCRRRDLQASHFYSRRWLLVRWDDRNVHAMCSFHNQLHNTDSKPYTAFMVKTYGEDTIAELFALRNQKRKLNDYELEEMLDEVRKQNRRVA